MPTNECPERLPTLRTMLTSVMESSQQPVSTQMIRKGRLAASAVAVAGGAAVLFGWGGSAEAKTVDSSSPKIQKGDTLSALAAKHGVSVDALAKANGLSPSATIFAGQPLTVPQAGTVREKSSAATAQGSYTVKRGDTLSSIAASRNISISALAGSNGLSLKKVLPIGKTLVVPAPIATSPTASSAPKVSGSKSSSGSSPRDMAPNDPRQKLRPQFAQAAAQYGLPKSFLEAVTWNESGWQNHATSVVGARGIGQIMSGTAQHINEMAGTKLDVNKPGDNIKMSAYYLRYLLDETRGDYKQALAAYYQGLGSLRSRGMYEDTKQYVATITALQKNHFS